MIAPAIPCTRVAPLTAFCFSFALGQSSVKDRCRHEQDVQASLNDQIVLIILQGLCNSSGFSYGRPYHSAFFSLGLLSPNSKFSRITCKLSGLYSQLSRLWHLQLLHLALTFRS